MVMISSHPFTAFEELKQAVSGFDDSGMVMRREEDGKSSAEQEDIERDDIGESLLGPSGRRRFGS